MDEDRFTFNRGAIRPMDCLRDGWRLIKEDYWLFLGLTFVGVLIAQLGPFGILLGPAMCGIHVCLLRQQNGQQVKFDMLFQGFNYFGQSFIATLFILVPALVLSAVYVVIIFGGLIGAAAMAGQQQQGDAAFGFMIAWYLGWTLALILAMVPLQALFIFVFPLIVDRELTGWEAARTSFSAVFANRGGILVLMLLQTLLGLLGEMACCVGVVFVLPVSIAMTSIAYRQVFPVIDPYEDLPYDDEPAAPFVVQDEHVQSREPRSSHLQPRPADEPPPANP